MLQGFLLFVEYSDNELEVHSLRSKAVGVEQLCCAAHGGLPFVKPCADQGLDPPPAVQPVTDLKGKVVSDRRLTWPKTLPAGFRPLFLPLARFYLSRGT